MDLHEIGEAAVPAAASSASASGGYSFGHQEAHRGMHELMNLTEDTYQASLFRPTRSIENMHNWPRYGFTKDIRSIVDPDGSSELQKEYIQGVVMGSIVILIVAVVWLLVLLVLKCCGRRVGCASGTPRRPKRPASEPPAAEGFEVPYQSGKAGDGTPVPASPMSGVRSGDDAEYQLALQSWELRKKKHERTMLATRIIFLAAGLGAIIASILFYTKGAGSLIDSITTTQRTLDYTTGVLLQGVNLTEAYVDAQKDVALERNNFVGNSTRYCTALPDNVNVGAEIDRFIDEINSAADSVAGQFVDQARALGGDLRASAELANDINNSLDSIKPWFWVALVIAMVLNIIILLLMLSVVLAMSGVKQGCFFRCIRNIMVLPILLLFMFLAWLFAAAFVVAAVVAADFCMQPDQYVLDLLESYQSRYSGNSIVFQFLKYYVSACNQDQRPLQLITELQTTVQPALVVVHDFLEFIGSDPTVVGALTQICGEQGANLVEESAAVLHDQVHVVNGLLIGVIKLLQCGSMNPIYTGIMHRAACTDGIDGLDWIFATQLAIAVCCMIMVTLRASWYEIEQEEEEAAKNDLRAETGENAYEPYDPERQEDMQEMYFDQDGPKGEYTH